MIEYIEREAAYPLAKKICDAFHSGEHSVIEMPFLILDWIDDLPAADVRPVVRGRWEQTPQGVDEHIRHRRCAQQAEEVIPVLYVDDFFKGGSNDADVRIAFEILNSRYNDTSLRTLISSEYSLSEICQIDEALGSRIYERSKGYRLKAPNENWRLK